MADNEPPEEISASTTELHWPDPSRPIINSRLRFAISLLSALRAVARLLNWIHRRRG